MGIDFYHAEGTPVALDLLAEEWSILAMGAYKVR